MPAIKVQTPTDPGLSSRPPAFTIPPTAKDATAPKDGAKTDPAAPTTTNDTNVFSGFPDVQSGLADLLPGNFKDTKYKWYGFVRLDGIYDFKPDGQHRLVRYVEHSDSRKARAKTQSSPPGIRGWDSTRPRRFRIMKIGR